MKDGEGYKGPREGKERIDVKKNGMGVCVECGVLPLRREKVHIYFAELTERSERDGTEKVFRKGGVAKERWMEVKSVAFVPRRELYSYLRTGLRRTTR